MSLGFSCGVKEGISRTDGYKKYSTYKELTITGYKICEIPTLLPYKKLASIENETQIVRSKTFMCSNFNLVESGVGPYVGWQLHDKRGRFCLKDGLSVHNTPEGASVGIVKNMSYMAHITIHSNSNSLHEYVESYVTSLDKLSPTDVYEQVKVFINGAWIGIANDPQSLYIMLKDMKCKGIINIYTSVIFDYKLQEIRLCNDSGRITRPLLRVKDKNILITQELIEDLKQDKLSWDDLLTNCKLNDAVIEYIDPEEQSFSLIATKPKELFETTDLYLSKYTHCEIHPSTIFGVVASCIPYPDHNQSPRNTYQCLDINETVLLSNGSKIPIKDITIGDEVVCFNPENMETSYTKVINHYVRDTDKRLYKITTLCGREIIATEDHRFMTIEGWCEVKNMSENETKIGILPHQQNKISICNDAQMTILNEEQFYNFFINNDFGSKLIEKYIFQLTNCGLLPLYNTTYNLPILARIFGFILADGSINIYEKNGNKFTSCSFDFGTEDDIKTFENDIHLCGFNKCKYNKSSRQFNDVTHTTYAVTHGGAFPALLLALGVSYGKKTENVRKQIPNWIMNGNQLIKREFLSGFQGGDGCKIRWNKINKGYNFVCAETSQQINPLFRDSLNLFMTQCIILLREFDIEVSNSKQIKVEDNRIKISYKISDKHNNLIKYFDNIGYRYCSTKNTRSFIVIEYLKYKQTLFEKHKLNIETIRNLYNENNTNTSIANKLNVKVSYVSDVIRSYKNNRRVSMRHLGEDTIETWNEIVTLCNNMLFVPIKSIEEVNNRLISDITVESDNHSFIAGNNFLSSNCAQAKQAMGIYATNFNERMDKTAYVLSYATRPLVDTRVMNLIKLNEIPSGCNINVAIMTHTGYNQEDSLLVNQGSIDRGLLQITISHTEKDEDKQKINGDEEIRCKPDTTKTKGMKIGNYNKVNSKGIVPENTLIENRDIIIAKVTPIKENRNDHTKVIKYEDQSKMYKTVEETYIDKNYIDRNGDGYSFAKVRLRALRKPVIGDKFSSRHGQKGTVGNIIPEEDMPFTKDGVRPDIIINPHAIPSRMTIGQLKETLLGKVLVQLGLFGDGTSFGELDVDTISKKLLELGYEAHGNELMYNGLTGEQIECNVFMGPVFYQRLKHMVNDKAHSRSIGPMVNLTRQPAEGRSRDGGLRFGEMERDCAEYHSPIPLMCGLSVEIGSMENCNLKVLGWDETTNSIINSKKIGFMDKGEKECVDVTFQDGRKIRFTDNHKLLTIDNIWTKINEFILNETRIKTGITYPLIKVNEEINACDRWTLNVGKMKLIVTDQNSYFKTLAFARIIGYLWADGGIYYKADRKTYRGAINLGHEIDVNIIVNDLSLFCNITQNNFECKNYYSINIPDVLLYNIIQLKGIIIGKKIGQPSLLPEFILDPSCPLPIVREFLGGLFGGDGHTCVLALHRGKRDILTSISFSKSQNESQLDSLTAMMTNIQQLLTRFGIHKTTIQKFKETSSSKKKADNKSYQLCLHLDINELMPFHEKIGFRYCCHKSQRLEAGVSYKRLRNEVVRQHNWLVNRVDEITHFSEIKKESPDKIVHTKNAIRQAVNELMILEPIIHEYAIPSTHDITDHLIKGTSFGKFNSSSFPTAEEYLREIGALEWFLTEQPEHINVLEDEILEDEILEDEILEDEILEEKEDLESVCYGVKREYNGLPTMNLKIIDIRPAGIHKVYDIEVEKVHSFLANGIVAHNCMVSHGASRFTKERMYDVSDKYSVYICKKCGLIASYNDALHIHQCKTCDNRVDFAYVQIPYACKLLFQELTTMNVVPRVITQN
jgi:DNA-directed RNA polymerase beta subunit